MNEISKSLCQIIKSVVTGIIAVITSPFWMIGLFILWMAYGGDIEKMMQQEFGVALKETDDEN